MKFFIFFKKYRIKIHQIYLPRIIEVCYDKEEEIYRDFLLLMSKSYEDMEKIAGEDKCRIEVVKFLKRLGADEEFMAVIDREEYNRILEETQYEEEKERAIQEETINVIKALYSNGVTDIEVLAKSSNLSIEKIKEILNLKQ